MNADEFLENHFDSIRGWLTHGAVRITEQLSRTQDDLDIPGCICEIGVWYGKYLSALSAFNNQKFVLGLDVFLHNQQECILGVLSTFTTVDNIKLIRVNTRDLSATGFNDLVKDHLGVRYLSIDGGHEAKDVENDLTLSRAMVSNGAVIAIDDFLNPLAIGVQEGVNRFMLKGGDLEPIAYSSNKLWMTTPGWALLYQTKLRMWLQSSECSLGQAWRQDASDHIRQLFGHSILVL